MKKSKVRQWEKMRIMVKGHVFIPFHSLLRPKSYRVQMWCICWDRLPPIVFCYVWMFVYNNYIITASVKQPGNHSEIMRKQPRGVCARTHAHAHIYSTHNQQLQQHQSQTRRTNSLPSRCRDSQTSHGRVLTSEEEKLEEVAGSANR